MTISLMYRVKYSEGGDWKDAAADGYFALADKADELAGLIDMCLRLAGAGKQPVLATEGARSENCQASQKFQVSYKHLVCSKGVTLADESNRTKAVNVPRRCQ